MKQIAIGTVLVLLLLIGVLWFLRDDKARPPEHAAGPRAPKIEILQPRQRTPDAQAQKEQENTPEPPVQEPTKIVREHSADEAPPFIPISRHSVGILRARVTRAVRVCAERLQGSDVKGKVYIIFRATSAAGRMSVDNVRVKQAELDDDELVSCIVSGVAAVAAPAPDGQGDGSHEIQLTFVVP